MATNVKILNEAGGNYANVNSDGTLDVRVSGSKMRQVDSIMGAFAVSTSAISKTIADKNCTVHILSGNCWINPLATAVADATAIKLLSGMVMDLRVAATLSLISDATGASVQIIVWED